MGHAYVCNVGFSALYFDYLIIYGCQRINPIISGCQRMMTKGIWRSETFMNKQRLGKS